MTSEEQLVTLPTEPARWLTVPEVAEILDMKITAVHRALREGAMLGIRRNGVLTVPSELVTTNEQVAKHVSGVITLLRDAGLSDAAALTWLYTEEPSLAGTPVAALYGTKAREVKRQAQAL